MENSKSTKCVHAGAYYDTNTKGIVSPIFNSSAYDYENVDTLAYPRYFNTPNQKVVVIEDLISTGKSSLNAVNALRDAGNEVLGMLALFTYEFPVATEAFEKNNLSLQTLCNYSHLLETALHQNKITESEAKNLSIWREDPANWTP